jgi:hypothetical protein
MPPLKYKLPSYCLHKGTGQAVVTIDGPDQDLGPHGSPRSKAKYDAVIARWLATRHTPALRECAEQIPLAHLRINELLAAYLEYAEQYYRKNDKPTGEVRNIQDAIRPLRRLHEHTRVGDFGPVALKNVRQGLIGSGLARKVVNARINRIRRVVKWGVENQLVHPSVLQGLQAVAPLKA